MLRVDHLNVSYSGLQALWNTCISVKEHELVAIVGSNGAGKSTLLKTISGLLRSSSGSISFMGERIDNLAPHKICEKGIIHIPEGRKLFPLMKVVENLEMGGYMPEARRYIPDSLRQVYQLFPVLKERQNQDAGTLSGGEQQMLAIGRGLMARPKLLMLDEPTLGLSPKSATELLTRIGLLNKQGTTILLVSQEIFHSLRLAGRAYVIENGKIVLEGKGEELLQNDDVKASYLGL
jgi:branched-chain amino acid transport system ATP-binding protein